MQLDPTLHASTPTEIVVCHALCVRNWNSVRDYVDSIPLPKYAGVTYRSEVALSLPKGCQRKGQLPTCLQRHRTDRALCTRRCRKRRSDCFAKLRRCTRGYCEGERASLKPVTFLRFAAPFCSSTRAGGSKARRPRVRALRQNCKLKLR